MIISAEIATRNYIEVSGTSRSSSPTKCLKAKANSWANTRMTMFDWWMLYNCQTMSQLSISICWRSWQNLSLPCWQRLRSTGQCSGLPASWSSRMWRMFPGHSWCRLDDGSPWRGQLRGNCCWSPPWYSSLRPGRWRWHSDWTRSPPPVLQPPQPPHC